MVKGRLEFEPRITIENFEKMLPKENTIARAVGLESTHKGSRLLIENNLATDLLDNHQQWLTSEGYIRNVCQNVRTKDILRRICPTPNNSTYELLYFWICSNNSNRISTDYDSKKKELQKISKILKSEIAEHYKETIDLLDRCKTRQRLTEQINGNTSRR